MNSKQLFTVALVIYCIALIFPVWTVKGNNPIYGIEALVIGALAVLMLDPRWFCNLVLIYSTNCVFKTFNKVYLKRSLIMAAVGTTVIFGPFHGGLSMGAFDLFEGTGLDLGGYLWVISLWLFAISIYLRKTEIDSSNYP